MLKKSLLAAALGAAILMAGASWSENPFDALKARAEAGEVLAQRELGLRYLEPSLGHTDPRQGALWLAEAARGGDAEAAFQLGQYYGRQVGTGRSLNLQARQKQAQYLKQATLAGHAAATTALADLLLERAMDPDVPDAKRQRATADADALLRHAADHGYVPAMRVLAERLAAGRGLAADPIEALRYLQNAASANDAEAQYQLSLHYHDQANSDHSESRALIWLQKAAEAHHPEAVSALALQRLETAEHSGKPELATPWVALAEQLALRDAAVYRSRLDRLQTELESTLTRVDRDWVDAAPMPALADAEASSEVPTRASADLDASLLTDPVLARFSEQIDALEQRLNAMTVEAESLTQQLHDKDQQIAALTSERDAAVAAKQTAEQQLMALQATSGAAPRIAAAADTGQEQIASPPQLPSSTTAQVARADDTKVVAYQQGLTQLRQNQYEQARRAFERAARSGHPGALNNLGLMQVRGLGGKADVAAGMASLVRAANAGSVGAAESLAAMYDYGIGIRPDRALAIEYYRMAAARGSDKAAAGLQRLGVDNRQVSAR